MESLAVHKASVSFKFKLIGGVETRSSCSTSTCGRSKHPPPHPNLFFRSCPFFHILASMLMWMWACDWPDLDHELIFQGEHQVHCWLPATAGHVMAATPGDTPNAVIESQYMEKNNQEILVGYFYMLTRCCKKHSIKYFLLCSSTFLWEDAIFLSVFVKGIIFCCVF